MTADDLMSLVDEHVDDRMHYRHASAHISRERIRQHLITLIGATTTAVVKPCEQHPNVYCNCDGFYPACREAPVSTTGRK